MKYVLRMKNMVAGAVWYVTRGHGLSINLDQAQIWDEYGEEDHRLLGLFEKEPYDDALIRQMTKKIE